MVEYHGEYFDFPRLQIEPAPTQPVPVYVGGANRAALKRAAFLGDGWIGAGNTPEEVPAVMAELQSLRRQAGRESEPFETIVGVRGARNIDDYQRLQEHGMTSAVAPPFYFTLGKGSSLDEKKRAMEAFAARYIVPLA
jgi:alkanesulfonate monooxygenase SsuD/methylene tetrahydromethanopterin reductase-like flavin-dependent oxidoreductase (luciferase family)